MLSNIATIEQQSLTMHGENIKPAVQLLLCTNASMLMHTALHICSQVATMHVQFVKICH